MLTKKIFSVLVSALYFFALIVLSLTTSVVWQFLLYQSEVPYDALFAAAYFMRLSGILAGTIILIRWIWKWPFPVSWFSLGLGFCAFGLAFSAQAMFAKLTKNVFWDWNTTTGIGAAFWMIGVACWIMWIRDPLPQTKKPPRLKK